jgi:hypothetical protein
MVKYRYLEEVKTRYEREAIELLAVKRIITEDFKSKGTMVLNDTKVQYEQMNLDKENVALSISLKKDKKNFTPIEVVYNRTNQEIVSWK